MKLEPGKRRSTYISRARGCHSVLQVFLSKLTVAHEVRTGPSARNQLCQGYHHTSSPIHLLSGRCYNKIICSLSSIVTTRSILYKIFMLQVFRKCIKRVDFMLGIQALLDKFEPSKHCALLLTCIYVRRSR